MTAELCIGIVADARRGDQGLELAERVGADYVSIDPGGQLGGWANHMTVWREHVERPAQWAVTLEDDAVPVDDFREQLQAALAVAPAPIVSLYLGSGYINDQRVRALIRQADLTDSHWVLAHGVVLHGVALAIRGELLPAMIDAVGRREKPIDGALSRWARGSGHKVAYTMPSLVDHSDDESLVARRRRAPRRAHCTGRREQWNNRSILMV